MMTLQMGILFLAVLGLSTALICPDGGMCDDRNTCCKNMEGGYGCCPLPHAECCSDHLHCCYEGTLCDLVHRKCVNKTVSLPWMRRLPAKVLPVPQLSAEVKAVICPDQESECPDNTTCCQLPDGSWGCCPLANAVCCEDKRHCCPEGTKCDLVHSKCVSASLESFPLMKKLPATRTGDKPASAIGSVTCPGGKSSCPNSFTCCLLTSGEYGCCPYPEAVCCSDHQHCCPTNTLCDLEHQVCRSGETRLSLLERSPAIPTKLRSVPCNDSVACADGSTCCKNLEGDWACCPLLKAVCCEDHLHCCPHGTVCNLAASTCDDATGRAAMAWLHKGPTLPLPSTNGKCDESSSCPGESTCCKTGSGGWACCPLPKAVCCDDHTHCCPHATVCNVEAETCDSPSGSSAPLPWAAKVPAVTSQPQDEKCDRQTSCPGGTTCCKRNSGQWACCPLPQAPSSGRETAGPPSPPWLQEPDRAGPPSPPRLLQEPDRAGPPSPPRLLQELDRAVSENMCDAQTSCPGDATCCFMGRDHRWGCCPLPNAVCCPDGDHCCPSGRACEPHRASCSSGPRVVPWFSKRGALTTPAAADVRCDNKSSCAAGTTCCRLPEGGWGCCPLVKAVCCADHKHCCPHDYTCNMQTGTCEKKDHNLSAPRSKVVRSKPGGDGDVPCDGAFHCSGRDTCCQVSATEWACCPSPSAVCCSDSRHCCPAGYTCDQEAGGCTLKTRRSWDAWFDDARKDFVPRGL